MKWHGKLPSAIGPRGWRAIEACAWLVLAVPNEGSRLHIEMNSERIVETWKI
jgi:hypothetical protein